MAVGHLADCTAVRSLAECIAAQTLVGCTVVGGNSGDRPAVEQVFVGLEKGILELGILELDKLVLDAQALDSLVAVEAVVDDMNLVESVSHGME